MSERSLWSLVFENMDDAGPLVARYVNALCDEFPNKDGLEHLYPTEPYYCAGARALYGYFDHLEDRDELRNPENIPVFKAFRRYLDCVDMDHEVYEEDYISLVLKSGLRHLEPREMYLDLLHFRLMYGQAALGNRPYEDIAAIVKFGDLKPLVDFHIASVKKQVESGEYVEDWEFDEYRLLIAAIYGSDEKPARDVLEYVESRTGKAVPAAEEFRLEDIESLAAARDIFLEHYSGDGKRFANTGFHWFNTETRTWEKVAS